VRLFGDASLVKEVSARKYPAGDGGGESAKSTRLLFRSFLNAGVVNEDYSEEKEGAEKTGAVGCGVYGGIKV
jgi:hypothetical protein